MKRKSYFTISLFNFDCLMKMAKKLIPKKKKKNEDEKISKNEFEF